MGMGLMTVLTGRKKEALLPSIIHSGHDSICFNITDNANVAGGGLWGGLCLSIWLIVHQLALALRLFECSVSTSICLSVIQSQVRFWGS